MDDVGPASANRNFHVREFELPVEADRACSKKMATRDASQFLAKSLAMVFQGLFGQRIKATGSGILFHLAIPDFRVKMCKPHAELGEFLRVEAFHGLFNVK